MALRPDRVPTLDVLAIDAESEKSSPVSNADPNSAFHLGRKERCEGRATIGRTVKRQLHKSIHHGRYCAYAMYPDEDADGHKA